jgi:Uma2 family endonuclease
MAMAKSAAQRLSPDEYLAAENDGDVRHEYVDGQVYAMVGASEGHSIVKLNVTLWLAARIPLGCRLFDGDMKLRVDRASETRFYYPDHFISCGQADPKQYFRSDATLVVEVLSPSTARIDRYEKLQAYTSLPTLIEYLLIDQAVPTVELFRRKSSWARENYQLVDTIRLDSVSDELPVSAIYRSLFD